MRKSLSAIFLANAFTLLSGVVTSLLTAWALGAEGRGDLAVVVLYPNIIALAVGFGMAQGTRYFVASSPDKLSSLFPNAVFFSGALGVVALVAAELFVPSIVGERSELVMWLVRAYLINIPLALLYDMMAGILEGARKFKWAAISRIAFFGIQCVVYTGLWLTDHLTIANAAFTMVIAQIANTGIAFASVFFVLKPGWKPSLKTFKETLSFGLKYHLGVVTSFTTLRLDQMLLVGMATSVELGLYVIAVRLSEIMTVLASSVSEVLMPEVASSSGDDKSIKLLMRSVRLTLYVFGIAMLPLLFLSPYILQFAFGTEFVAGTSALRILLVASMVWSIGAIVNSGLNGLGYPGLSTLSRLSSAMITVLTLLIWLPRYGILGAALSSLTGYTVMLAVALFWLIRKKNLTLGEIFRPQRNDIPMKEISSFLGWPSGPAQEAQPRPQFAHELFERHAAADPSRVAITSKNGEMTYGELNARANQLAWHLRAKGVVPGTLVPICVDRSGDMAVGVLGILKSGAAFVPIDPAYPAERVAGMLDEIDASLVITQSGLCGESGIERVCLDADPDILAEFSTSDLPLAGTPDDLAYVIFTSGSTGRPKGTMLTNANLAHYLTALQKEFALTPSDNYLHLASIGFSSSRRHLLLPLSVGAGVVIADEDQRLDPIPLFQLVKEKGITIFDAVPSFQRHCLQELLELTDSDRRELLKNRLRLILSASEPLYSDIPKTWMRDFGHPAQHVHMFGQTETSGIIALNRITENDIEGEIRPVAIGTPIANTQIHLLDQDEKPVSVGEMGEIYVSGAGVGRGYVGDEELTSTKFIDLEIAGVPKARYCKTGDFARVGADGRFECVGRQDFQVKIRGNRVELGEIESVLLAHSSVQNCAVVGREDVAGDLRLIAYVVPAGGKPLPSEELREIVAASLPDYMRPSAYVTLDKLPLTPNGKLDRKALPTPDALVSAARTASAERLDTENDLIRSVAAMWAEVLGTQDISLSDDFFSLGGHSLAAGRLVSRVRSRLGVRIPIRSIFEAPNLAAFCDLVETALANQTAEDQPATTPRPQQVPLSFAQQRVWFLSEMDSGLTAYNECEILQLTGTLDTDALKSALEEIVSRHELLRTRFSSVNGGPCQVIEPHIDVVVETIDLRENPCEDRKEAAFEIARASASSLFDLQKGPLFRLTLVRTAEDEHYLIVVFHHTITDQWTVGVFLRELDVLYTARLRGDAPVLPPLTLQYADYALDQHNWLQTAECERQLAFWKEQLSGAPNILELPTDHPRPAVQRYIGRQVDRLVCREQFDRLNELCLREGVTPFMVLLAAWEVVMYRYSGQDQLVIGTPIAGRTSEETEKLIGFFVNTLAIRGDLSGDPTFCELLRRTKERALGAYANQDLPFEKLVEEINPERSMSYSPLFQVMFTLQNTPESSETIGDLSLARLRLPKASAKFDLSLDVFTREDGFALQLEFNTDLYEEETAERMLGHFQTVLESVIADPAQTITSVNLLTASEQELILGEWNSTSADIPPACLHELFEDKAASQPDAVAVVFGEESITYGELDKRANQLARTLQKNGVVPDQIVGIYLSRSIEMIVAVLGVMKAGGAYMPMDPNYPLDRLQYMLTEAGVGVLITTEDLHLANPELSADTILCLDRDRALISLELKNKPESAGRPKNLIYVTFTSGSTGRAKGVMIEHRNVVSIFKAWEQTYHLTEIASHLQMASFSFDVFTGDLSRALCSGAKLILCPTEVLLDPAKLYDMLASHRIEAAEFVPAVIRPLIQYLETENKNLDFLKLMVVGSDTWQSDEYRRLQNVCGADTRVINSYGVTEAAIDSTYFEMPETEEASAEFVPIGRPFANTQIYLLDQFGNPVPVGVPGELYQGGKGLARGYLNRPDLTAEKFVEIDLPTANGPVRERLYRTGDLARYRPDGNIAIIGRADNQVKLRGYRIELGEIESVLSRHDDVKESIVSLREDVPGEKRLIAYITTHSGTLDASELRSFLRGSLPEFMLPSGYVLMTEWKLTPNGKIDRKQLPVPDRIGSTDENSYVAPDSQTEKVLSEIWAELLRVEKVGVNDNFFELGGHSLLATQTVSRIRDLTGCEVPLRALFETPTIGEIAVRIDEQGGPRDMSAEEMELERLLSEIETVSDEEAERFLTQLDDQYSEAKLGSK